MHAHNIFSGEPESICMECMCDVRVRWTCIVHSFPGRYPKFIIVITSMERERERVVFCGCILIEFVFNLLCMIGAFVTIIIVFYCKFEWPLLPGTGALQKNKGKTKNK